MDRCGWCGRKLPHGQHFCCDVCNERYERTLARDQRCIKWFLLLLAAGVLTLFAGALSGQNALAGGGMLLTGSDILLFPLVTPETNAPRACAPPAGRGVPWAPRPWPRGSGPAGFKPSFFGIQHCKAGPPPFREARLFSQFLRIGAPLSGRTQKCDFFQTSVPNSARFRSFFAILSILPCVV